MVLKRVFYLDLEHCPNCGGELKTIAANPERPVIEKIFTHLGLQASAPPLSAAFGQALQAAWRFRSNAIVATRRQGPRGWAAP